MEQPIATAKVRLNGTTDYGYECKDEIYRFELWESGAFHYGNATCVVLVRERDGQKDTFDTRYDTTLHRDGSNFRTWALKAARQYFNANLTIELL